MVIPEISTTYRERERDAPRTAQIIDTIVAQHHGNYGVFFPSFAYLRLVRSWLRYPAYQLIEQTESMSDADRAAVLARLQQHEPILCSCSLCRAVFLPRGSTILVTCSLADHRRSWPAPRGF